MDRRSLIVAGAALWSGCAAESGDSTSTPTPNPAAFEVSVTSAPEEVTVGELATLEAEITNTGEQRGSTEYVLSIANRVINHEEVTLEGGESTRVEGQLDTKHHDPQELSYRADVGDDTATGSLELIEDVDYEEYYANIREQMSGTIPEMEFRYTDVVELHYISSAPDDLDAMRFEMAAFIGSYLRQATEFGMPPEELLAGAYGWEGNPQIMWKIAEEWVVKNVNGELSTSTITQMADKNLVVNPEEELASR